MIKPTRLRWSEHEARIGEGRTFKILTGKLTRKKSFGRTRRRWEDNIRMDHKEIDVNMRSWVDSAQDMGY